MTRSRCRKPGEWGWRGINLPRGSSSADAEHPRGESRRRHVMAAENKGGAGDGGGRKETSKGGAILTHPPHPRHMFTQRDLPGPACRGRWGWWARLQSRQRRRPSRAPCFPTPPGGKTERERDRQGEGGRPRRKANKKRKPTAWSAGED